MIAIPVLALCLCDLLTSNDLDTLNRQQRVTRSAGFDLCYLEIQRMVALCPMIKRLIDRLFNRTTLSAVVIRRYKITSGSIGELYIGGICVGDSLDTYSDDAKAATAIAIYDDFYHLRLEDKLVTNIIDLANKRLSIEFVNRWVGEY